MIRRALLGGILLTLLFSGGCLSSDFTLKTSGVFSGSYVSLERTYSGPMMFNFISEEDDIEVDGKITVDEDVIEFTGSGTLTSDPAELDLDVTGTDFTMHIWGKIEGGRLEGSYTFTSPRWGDHSGSVDLDRS